MDLNGIIRDLKAEREAICVAIESLQKLVHGAAKRRGRPPAWLKAMHQPTEEHISSAQAAPAGAQVKTHRTSAV